VAIHLVLLVGLPSLSLLNAFEKNDWKLLDTLKQSMKVGKSAIIMNHFPSLNQTSLLHNVSGSVFALEMIFGFMNILIALPYHLLSSYRITSFVYPGMILHTATKAFVAGAMIPFHKGCSINRDWILQKYSELKRLTDALNEVWSLTFFFVMVDHILWLTTDLNLGLQERAWTRKVIVTWFFIGVIILMVYASEVSRKVSYT